MTSFEAIGHGLAVALQPQNVLFCFFGCLLGTLIGVLPGIGPVATIAILLPATFSLDPTTALIMLSGIFYGTQYGGSTTAILAKMPGEASSVVTCIDGHEMARQNRAGVALCVAAIGSFFAGTVATFLIVLVSPPLNRIASSFGAPEYFSLMVLGLIAATTIARGSVLKSIAMIFLGLLIGLVGIDINSGEARFTFGTIGLLDGVSFVALGMGIYGVTELVAMNERGTQAPKLEASPLGAIWPSRQEWRRSWPAIFRGTSVGCTIGVLPGAGTLLSSFVAYIVELKSSRTPERFGKGAIEGVAGPEAANNASAQISFIPMLVLGIPPNATMALLLGALIIHGISPGPFVMQREPDLFWGLIASMWVGNLMLLVINLPLISVWVMVLKTPQRILYPCILLLCTIGAYGAESSVFNVFVLAAFGLFGYLLLKLDFDPAPLILGFILGPMMETNLRRSMIMWQGDLMVFLYRPISLALLLLALLLLVVLAFPAFRSKRESALAE
jgi:TctA family transporter